MVSLLIKFRNVREENAFVCAQLDSALFGWPFLYIFFNSAFQAQKVYKAAAAAQALTMSKDNNFLGSMGQSRSKKILQFSGLCISTTPPSTCKNDQQSELQWVVNSQESCIIFLCLTSNQYNKRPPRTGLTPSKSTSIISLLHVIV